MSNKNCLIIFTRVPELGKVKTRLAEGIGNENALKIYNHLLEYSSEICKDVNADKHVWYTPKIQKGDIWNDKIFIKHVQPEGDLGLKMKYAFDSAFKMKYQNVIIIGTDLLDIDQVLIEKAFDLLQYNDVVIGPATDGGYYLLGLKEMQASIFANKSWGTSEVFSQTMKDLRTKNIAVLDFKNDIDYIEDLEHHQELLKLIKQ
jgi:hypothetical protein